MLPIILVVSIILILLVLYLLSLRTNSGRQNELHPFEENYIAHRGLFDNISTPENSLAAFKNAINAGYGIELDVQLTLDNKLVVFHDETLERMCFDPRVLSELSYSELCKLSLLNTDEKIPLLKDVLELINGTVPVVVEIKMEGNYLLTSQLTNKLLLDYNGIFCVESFHPLVLNWFRKNNPKIIRGQLSTNHSKDGSSNPWITQFIFTNLLLNFLSKPDFIAYNHKYKNQFSYRLCRKLYKPINVAWTISNQKELEAARDVFEIFIFDSFIPNK